MGKGLGSQLAHLRILGLFPVDFQKWWSFYICTTVLISAETASLAHWCCWVMGAHLNEAFMVWQQGLGRASTGAWIRPGAVPYQVTPCGGYRAAGRWLGWPMLEVCGVLVGGNETLWCCGALSCVVLCLGWQMTAAVYIIQVFLFLVSSSVLVNNFCLNLWVLLCFQFPLSFLLRQWGNGCEVRAASGLHHNNHSFLCTEKVNKQT